jgi:hypothetical protein
MVVAAASRIPSPRSRNGQPQEADKQWESEEI